MVLKNVEPPPHLRIKNLKLEIIEIPKKDYKINIKLKWTDTISFFSYLSNSYINFCHFSFGGPNKLISFFLSHLIV